MGVVPYTFPPYAQLTYFLWVGRPGATNVHLGPAEAANPPRHN